MHGDWENFANIGILIDLDIGEFFLEKEDSINYMEV